MARTILMTGIAGNHHFIELSLVGLYFVVTLEARNDGSLESHSFQDPEEALAFFNHRCTQRIVNNL